MSLLRVLWAMSLGIVTANAGILDPITNLIRDPICVRIENTISTSSAVYYFGHPLYFKGVSHWAASSSELSKCVVEPGTAEDVARVLKIVGETRTPFAVKGGGHTTNAGFSSSPGVHISMYRFSQVNYNKNNQVVEIGAGLLWDDVYAQLEPHNVNVLGGRVTGVGVAGFILGGGYSWKTNQYGMTVDTVVAFELVTPGGAILSITEASNPEVFFALKGTQNNLGIVTKFTLKTYPQTKVWGGSIYYSIPFLKDVGDATVNFHQEITDPKASIITTFGSILNIPLAVSMLFYDGLEPPNGTFDAFLRIPSVNKDVKTRTFLSLVKSSPSNYTMAQRGMFDTVPLLDVTTPIVDAIISETANMGAKLTLATNTFFSYSIEPFLPNLYSHSTLPSAFPWTRAHPYMPLNLYAAWVLPISDAAFHSEVQASAKRIRDLAISQGQDIQNNAPKYVNYAPKGTDIEMVYGPSDRIERLKSVKRLLDPQNVMGLAGGFKIPL